MKVTYGALADLVGQAEPLDPSKMQYRSVPAVVWVSRKDALKSERACNQCIFKGQKSKVCVQAGQLARLAGHNDCEDRDTETDKTFIYELVPTDPRQLTIA
jgi:hypothetical protein